MSSIANAPAELVRQLAHDNDISVAGPVLTQSVRLAETDLVDIAETKGQAHLHALSSRKGIGEAVTDVLVRRGNEEVARSVADNTSARLSNDAFSALVNRAEKDGVLAEKVGKRLDIPSHLFRELLMRATDVVQRRLLATAKPETQSEIRRVLAQISKELNANAVPRDYTSAQRTVLDLHNSGRLGESELVDFAKSKNMKRRWRHCLHFAACRSSQWTGLPAASDPTRCSFCARQLDLVGRRYAPLSRRNRETRAYRTRCWMRPIPTSNGFRPRRRNAWCGSGKCGKRTTKRADRSQVASATCA
jgi:hypothetical protein